MGILDDVDEKEDYSEEKTGSKKPSRSKTLAYFIGVLLLLGFTIGGSFYVIKQKPELLGLSKSMEVDEKELERIVTQVGELMLLPDETPTLATVTDLSKVIDQPFFKNAKEGDKILVYRVAKKAILYRPSENKIIEVGVVNIQEDQNSQNPNQDIEVELLPSLTPTPVVSPLPTTTVSPSPSPTLSQEKPMPTIQ